jgi:hypothetical protein
MTDSARDVLETAFNEIAHELFLNYDAEEAASATD